MYEKDQRRNSLGLAKTLESLTQKAAIAHESRKLAGVAVAVAEFAFASLPDKMSPGQDALENAKECPSDFDTRVQKKRGFMCGLARAASANDEVIVSGYWSKRGNGTTTGRLACAQCAQMGEAESVSRQEDSTGHGPRLAERAPNDVACSDESGVTAVRPELIAHLDCRFRRKAFDAHAEEECGDTRAGECNCLVPTGDVLSFAFLTSDFFPAKSTSVCCSGRRSVNCVSFV